MIFNGIALLGSGLFYLLFFLSYYSASKKYFVTIYLFLSIFHDFLFINLEYYVNPQLVLIVKSWQELLALFLLFNSFLHFNFNKLNKRYAITLLIILVLSLWGVFVGLSNGVSYYEIFVGWRKYILIFLNSFMLYSFGIFHEVTFRYYRKVLILFTLLIIGYGFYQYRLFADSDLDIKFLSEEFYKEAPELLGKFWFYDKFGWDHMLGSWPNYVRDGSPRLTSVFVSPIILSEYLSILFLIALITFFKGKISSIKKILYMIFLIFVFIMMILSHTRIGFVQVALGLVIAYSLTRKVASNIYWVSVFGMIGFLMFLLIYFKIGDESAQGRLPQYVQMFTQFTISGKGYGSYESTIFFDSLYISVVFLFGLGSLFYFYLYYYWIDFFLKGKSQLEDTNSDIQLELRIVSGILCSYIFAFAFQFSIGSSPFILLNFLLFAGISHQKSRP